MGKADFPIFQGNVLSASVGNRAAVEHSPVVCPFRVWVMRCQNVGGQANFSHFPAFSFDSEPGRFLRKFSKMYERGNMGLPGPVVHCPSC